MPRLVTRRARRLRDLWIICGLAMMVVAFRACPIEPQVDTQGLLWGLLFSR